MAYDDVLASVDTEADGAKTATRRSRTLLVGFVGSVARRLGNWMPIAGVVTLMGQLGVDESSVRTAVFRLKKRGWLEPERREAKGYRLTDHALEKLREGDEVIWHSRPPARLEDGWCIVTFSVPESARSKRYQLRSHLATLGFGNVGSRMWIAPARMLSAAEKAVSELDLTQQTSMFVGSYAGGIDLPELLRTGWDLDALRDDYRAFIAQYSPLAAALDEGRGVGREEAFVAYVSAIDAWRRLPFADPGLPRELLGDDWPGGEATALFERLVAHLQMPALAHAASYWPSAE